MSHKTEPNEGGFFLEADIEEDNYSSQRKKVCFSKKIEAVRIKIHRPKK